MLPHKEKSVFVNHNYEIQKSKLCIYNYEIERKLVLFFILYITHDLNFYNLLFKLLSHNYDLVPYKCDFISHNCLFLCSIS